MSNQAYSWLQMRLELLYIISRVIMVAVMGTCTPTAAKTAAGMNTKSPRYGNPAN